MIPALLDRLAHLESRPGVVWQFVFVNDGSTDDTRERLECQRELRNVVVVNLSRNFGQQAAYRAGMDYANGDALVFMDADLQDPPEMIPEMVDEWNRGATLVACVRRTRPERGLRGALLRVFHRTFHWLTDGVMPRDSGTFGLMDRTIADRLRAMPELSLFLPALRSWVGGEPSVLYYDRAARVGQPKQSLRKLFDYAADGISSFSEKPLRLIGWLGLVLCLASLVYAAALVAIRTLQIFGLFGNLRVMGFTTMAAGMLALGGVQLLSIGIVAEYIAKVYRECKRRPIYIVQDVKLCP